LILELGTGGDLWERIKEKGKHNEQESRNILEQIVKALDYCHGHRVAHRDLKPENIVFCEDPETGGEVVKITDFGLSNQSDNEEAMMNTFCKRLLWGYCGASVGRLRARGWCQFEKPGKPAGVLQCIVYQLLQDPPPLLTFYHFSAPYTHPNPDSNHSLKVDQWSTRRPRCF
jgi:serine/threonine protein kinase